MTLTFVFPQGAAQYGGRIKPYTAVLVFLDLPSEDEYQHVGLSHVQRFLKAS